MPMICEARDTAEVFTISHDGRLTRWEVRKRALLDVIGLTFALIACKPGAVAEPRSEGTCPGAKPLSIHGRPTGFELCGSGLLHRVAAVQCPAAPRPQRLGKAAGIASPDGHCRVHGDCRARPHGYCLEPLPDGPKRCSYGCVQDSDCDSGEICLCDEPIGRCVPATCSSNEECEPPFKCAVYSPQPGCFYSNGFACQSERDECAVDEDCTDRKRCGWEEGRRVCVTYDCVY